MSPHRLLPDAMMVKLIRISLEQGVRGDAAELLLRCVETSNSRMEVDACLAREPDLIAAIARKLADEVGL